MNTKSDLPIHISIGFAIGAFMALLAGGPEMWLAVAPDFLMGLLA